MGAGFAFRHTGQGESAGLALPHDLTCSQYTGQDGASEYLAGILVELVPYVPDRSSAAPNMLGSGQDTPPSVYPPEHKDVTFCGEWPVGVVGVPTEPIIDNLLGLLGLIVK